MIENSDFPHPPKHYLEKNESNFNQAPNVFLFLSKTKQIVLLGRNINLA